MMRTDTTTETSLIVKAERYVFPIVTGIIFLLALVTDWYIAMSRVLTIFTFLTVIHRLGKGIILRELIALHSLLICLFMPTVGYTIYTKENALAKLWVRYMPVSEEQYFSYALPAMAIFVVILCWPISSKDTGDQGEALQKILTNAKKKLETIPKTGLYLMIIGTATSMISSFMPASVQFITTLIYWSSFAGVLYVYFTRSFRYKHIILLLFACLLFLNALRSGMFTIVIYMAITMFSFFFLGNKTAFWKKLVIFAAGLFVVFILQSVKAQFRAATWIHGSEQNKVSLFASLVTKKVTAREPLFDEKTLFPIYYRTNQGFNVALVIRRFPEMKQFDMGTNLFRALFSAFVPRFLWPDKPEAGGKFNMQYYTGMVLKNWSTNVGPLGEGYGSFGRTGGIIFMFVLGAFIRWSYVKIFRIARRLPLIIFWIPVLFYQVTYSAESDTLQILNSLFKSAFFVWGMYKLFPALFGVIKRQIRPVAPAPRPAPGATL